MISCGEYDYIEIVCTYQYPIKITMKSGDVIEGTAKDTKRNDRREECVLVAVNGLDNLVVLDNIAKLEVCTENPHFQEFVFS